MYVHADTESEPDTEFWEEDEDDIRNDLGPETIEQPPSLPNELTVLHSTMAQLYVRSVVKFLLVMQAVFRLPDSVVAHILKFLKGLFSVLGPCNGLINEIAQEIPTLMYIVKKLSPTPTFTRYVVCKSCSSIYTRSQCIETSFGEIHPKKCPFKPFPNHPHASRRLPCGTVLLKTVELANQKRYLYPHLMYCYLGLEASLQLLLDKPNFYNDCEHWRHRVSTHGELSDIYDGKVWKHFLNYESKPFLSEAGNLGLLLNFDFFQPYDHISYSLGALYLSVLNLQRKIRYKRENMILVGLIPGPHEPERSINTFLKPLVEDLQKLWIGVNFNVHSIGIKKIRCALMCIATDVPAGRKLCGFLGHSARLGCSKCLREFPGGIGNKDYSGFDRTTWVKRTHATHKVNALSINKLTTAAAVEKAESEYGCRYSELVELPYFDAPRMLVIDPMHNLFLGIAKYFLKNILISRGYLSDNQLVLIQKRINDFVVPSGISKVRIKIASGFSKLTADQWKNWVFYFSIIALRDMVSRDILEYWRLFVLACRTLCTKTVTLENVKLGDAFLLQFCCRVERFFGKECITPNMHLSCHLGQCMEDYGPVHGFWCYPFERYNGLMGSTPHNNRSIECQMMQRIIRENQALFLTEENIPEVLLHCFPQKGQTGSVAETMMSSDNVADITCTLDAIQSVTSLPKCKINCALSNTQKRNIKRLYCSLYDASINDIEIAQTCLVYKSVQFNGINFGSYKDRTKSSSIVMTNYDPSTFQPTVSRAARVNKFCEHTAHM